MQRLEVSGAVRPLYGSLGVKGLIVTHMKLARVSLVQNGECVKVTASCPLTSSNVLKTKVKESALLYDIPMF